VREEDRVVAMARTREAKEKYLNLNALVQQWTRFGAQGYRARVRPLILGA